MAKRRSPELLLRARGRTPNRAPGRARQAQGRAWASSQDGPGQGIGPRPQGDGGGGCLVVGCRAARQAMMAAASGQADCAGRERQGQAKELGGALCPTWLTITGLVSERLPIGQNQGISGSRGWNMRSLDFH